jgi:broad specificity phosphatase PhoE
VTTILLVAHMDAGDRSRWPGNQDQRPLGALGWKQAEALRDALIGRGITALYSSNALRARQTLEPLAEATGLRIEALSELSEKVLREDRSATAERGVRALEMMAEARPGGVVAAASHGDIVPYTAALIGERNGVAVAELTNRSQWYEFDCGGGKVGVTLHAAPAGFPL